MFLELNSKGLYQSSGKEKESCCLVFPSSTKREIRHFHVVVVQRRQRNVQKSVMHVQSCCFACLNLLLFCRSRSRRRKCDSRRHSTTSFSESVVVAGRSYQMLVVLSFCDRERAKPSTIKITAITIRVEYFSRIREKTLS